MQPPEGECNVPPSDEGPMSCALFMRRVPEVLRPLLPQSLQHIKWRSRNWLVQIYYGDPAFHYEIWALPGGERLEMGLHFESKNRLHNQHLLHAFDGRMIEIKAELGDQVEAEPWDKGWSKVYETLAREELTRRFLEQVALRLARVIEVLEPMLRQALETLPTAVSRGMGDNGHDVAPLRPTD